MFTIVLRTLYWGARLEVNDSPADSLTTLRSVRRRGLETEPDPQLLFLKHLCGDVQIRADVLNIVQVIQVLK